MTRRLNKFVQYCLRIPAQCKQVQLREPELQYSSQNSRTGKSVLQDRNENNTGTSQQGIRTPGKGAKILWQLYRNLASEPELQTKAKNSRTRTRTKGKTTGTPEQRISTQGRTGPELGEQVTRTLGWGTRTPGPESKFQDSEPELCIHPGTRTLV
jgi:hypothetical protein